MITQKNTEKTLEKVIAQYNELSQELDTQQSNQNGYKILVKITEIVKDLGKNFKGYDGSTLSEYQMKLAGYKFFLADYVADIEGISKTLKLEVKQTMASRWSEVTEDLIANNGKVKNKQEVENVIDQETVGLQQSQVLFETMFYKYKLKISAINDIITTLTMQISNLKTEMRQQV